MKNTRAAAAVAFALAGTLALSACTPPHENDGEKFVDTVTTGPKTPQIDPSGDTDKTDSHSHSDKAEMSGTPAATTGVDAPSIGDADPQSSMLNGSTSVGQQSTLGSENAISQ